MTPEEIEGRLEYIASQQSKINFNNKLFEIMEGDLLKYVEKAMHNQLKPENAGLAIKRASPINVWNKIVSKLSKLYTQPVIRKTENATDQELVDYYVERGLDVHMGNMNENYNAYKWSSIEIFEDVEAKALSFRSIPSNQFLVHSSDQVNPMRVTSFIKFMGTENVGGTVKNKYWEFGNDYAVAYYSDKTIAIDDVTKHLNEGKNPYGVIPFEYIGKSQYLLIPNPDEDTMQMTILLPVLITDQNFGSMYLSHPIITVTDGDAENLPATPNMFWNLKSDDEKTASVGVVKAEPNLRDQMNHVVEQLNMWLGTRDIRPGAVGSITSENFTSGVSKIISEMDTLENRKDQEVQFKMVEKRLWRKIAIMHNVLAAAGRIENRKKFSDPEKLVVNARYSEEKILESRADKVLRLKTEKEAGFASLSKAIKELNPHMTPKEIDAEMLQIEKESTTTIEVGGDE